MDRDRLEVQIQRRRLAEERPATLLRAEHVWVAVPTSLSGHEWVPAVLQEWRRGPDGEWSGHVAYAFMWWQQSDREPSHWSGFLSTEWVTRRRIRRLDPKPSQP